MQICAGLITTLALICGIAAADAAATKVVFVCEHGNVKSLMAASCFNQLAEQRGLPFRAVSRGVAPDSIERWTDVPAASSDFDAARASLKAHVAALLDRLAPK